MLDLFLAHLKTMRSCQKNMGLSYRCFELRRERTLGVRPHKEKINISKEFINKTKGAVAPYAARISQKSFDKSHPSPW